MLHYHDERAVEHVHVIHYTSLGLLPFRVDAQLLVLPSACFCSYFWVGLRQHPMRLAMEHA